MPKQTDIVGTVRVPEEHMGRFWNFMRSMPTCEFTPTIAADMTPTQKRVHGSVKNGSTGKCILLNALAKGPDLLQAGCRAVLVNAGKAPASVANVVFELKRDALIKRAKDQSYGITAKGRKFLATSCNIVE